MSWIKGLVIGQHYPVESFVHRLDARTKIIATLLYMIALFSAAGPTAYLFLTIFSAFALGLSNLPMRLVWRGLKPSFWIIGFTLAIHTLTTRGGVELWSWGPLLITSGGVMQGLIMCYRLLMMVITTSLLTLTTSPIQLTDGLESCLSFLKRFGFPAHELAMMMTIALRFVPTLIEEADKISKAQTARGADFESGSLFERLRSLLPLLVPLFISAFRRAEDLAIAMEARCYRGGEGRGRFHEARRTASDRTALGLTAALLISVCLLKFSGIDRWPWSGTFLYAPHGINTVG